jgi:hypothetical protein
LQLSGLDSQYCSFDGNFGAGADLDGSGVVAPNPATGSGCSLSSSFGALILAAFFGLLGLLAPSRAALLTFFFTPRPVRYLWPSANPPRFSSFLMLGAFWAHPPFACGEAMPRAIACVFRKTIRYVYTVLARLERRLAVRCNPFTLG